MNEYDRPAGLARSLAGGPLALVALSLLVVPGDLPLARGASPPPGLVVVPPDGPLRAHRSFEVSIRTTDDGSRLPDASRVTVHLMSPSHGYVAVPAFQEDGELLARLSVPTEETWEVGVLVDGERDPPVRVDSPVPTRALAIGPPAGPGPVRVSRADPERLAHRDGSRFVGVGWNRCWDLTPAMIREAATAGANVLGLWLAPWDLPLVTDASGPSRVDPDTARRVDELVETAEEEGVRLLLAIWPHDALRSADHPWVEGGWADPAWAENPFRDLTDPAGFFSDETEAWEAQRALYREVVARWAASPAILAWHLVAEIDGTHAGEAATAWVRRTHDLFRELDPWDHPTTVSGSGHHLFADGQEICDLAQAHLYPPVLEGTMASPILPVAERLASFDRPTCLGEVGAPEGADRAEALHDALWSALAAGVDVLPLWWVDGSERWPPLGEAELASVRSARAFIEALPPPAGRERELDLDVLGPRLRVARARTDDRTAHGWLLADGPVEAGSLRLRTDVPHDGSAEVVWWDPRAGEPVATRRVDAWPQLVLEVPAFDRDLAFIVRPVE